MFELDLLVRMKINITEKLNERLEQGESQAFKELETILFNRLNPDWVDNNNAGDVNKVQIEDAGPYNDARHWEPSKFYCKHKWEEQPGEPPKDICINCGEVKE